MCNGLTQECKKKIFWREFWELLRWQMFEVQKVESFPSHPSVVVSLKVAIPIWKAATFECKKLPPFFHKKGMKSTRKKVETFIIILGWRNIVSHVDLWQACFTYKRIFLRDIGTVLGKKVGFLFFISFMVFCAVCNREYKCINGFRSLQIDAASLNSS